MITAIRLIGITKMFKKSKSKYGEYPCNDYLNNALRFLLKSPNLHSPEIVNAIADICYCISTAHGKFADDVAHDLAITGLCPYKKPNQL